jgi:bifunctional UDP-N-acetylglucosamine pyrophosphorylase/glucosamine-1-phosphate N-acetyltransferase
LKLEVLDRSQAGERPVVDVAIGGGETRHVASKRPLALIVLAAGGGTRMRSAVPKVLHSIGGRTLLSHVLRAAAGADPAELVVVVSPDADDVEAETRSVAPAALTAVQQRALGTGDAVNTGLRELPDFEGTVIVLFGDTPLVTTELITGLAAAHDQANAPLTVLTAELDDPTGYGRVVRGARGGVRRIVEHRDASADELAIREINSGVMAFDAAVLRSGLGRLSTANDQGELYLTEIVGIVAADGDSVRAVVSDDSWQTVGCNDRTQLAKLGAELNRRVCDAWMTAGVTMTDPATTWVDVETLLAPDVTLLPGVQLLGHSQIASGAVVGPDSTLRDVSVGHDAEVSRTHAVDAIVGDGATVGPFAYLRPGTVIEADGKVGTFVETKNAHLGRGAKVPHLSYVGDAEIGEATNIGAGTIFANYDGVRKHHTVVGRDCRTGSDNVFVAPVSVGDGAATGAGTVIRRNVPPGALAVSAANQRHLEGWVARKWPGSAAARAARDASTDGSEQS